IYEYTVCNNVGEVERLGLASDILKIVPFDAQAMQNGPTGKRPNCPLIWFILIITGLILVVAAVLATIYLFVKLWEFLAKWGLKLLASFAEAAKQALENAVKIIILTLAYIILAINFIIMLLGFCLMSAILYGIAILANLNYTQENLFKISISDITSENVFILRYRIIWIYVEFIDLEIPFSILSLEIGNQNQIIFESKNSIIPSIGKSEDIINLNAINKDLLFEESRINYDYDYNGQLTAAILILIFLSIFIIVLNYNISLTTTVPIMVLGLLGTFLILFTISLVNEIDQALQYLESIFLIAFGLIFINTGIAIIRVSTSRKTKFDWTAFYISIISMLLYNLKYLAKNALNIIILITIHSLNSILISVIGYLINNVSKSFLEKLLAICSYFLLGLVFLGIGITAYTLGLTFRYIL
ncbi:MAG: hypothetical protein ACTSRP_20480, partial [Candidatus Helarchaeota archaeon]